VYEQYVGTLLASEAGVANRVVPLDGEDADEIGVGSLYVAAPEEAKLDALVEAATAGIDA
jgi:hypothetical protein